MLTDILDLRKVADKFVERREGKNKIGTSIMYGTIFRKVRTSIMYGTIFRKVRTSIMYGTIFRKVCSERPRELRFFASLT